jgi:chromosome segregation ATPase
VDKLKTCEAKLSAQDEAHKAEVEDLKKKLAEMNENFEVAKAKQEISEMERSRVQKNVEELRDSKERCYETSIECAKKLKDSFAKVGAHLWGTIIRGTLKALNSQLVTPISTKLQRPDGCD